MARVLVTGGSGMIGSEVAKLLLAEKHEVVIFDFWPVNVPGTIYFKGSILDKEALYNAMQGCDYVMHLAAILGVENSTRNPLECLDVNIRGTINVLDAAVKNKVKKIVFSSSSEVYGEANIIPIPEHAVRQPKSEYGVSKVVGEEYLKAFYHQYGLNFNIVRFFSIYGPKQTPNFVLSTFVNNIINNKPLQVYGDGQQIRSFCYVEDAARGAITALFSSVSGEIFNIGNSKTETSMLDLAKLVIKIYGKNAELKLVPFENSDRTKEREIFRRLPDVSKAKKLLNFEARIGLEEGIRMTLEGKL